jgi:RNA polymerase sigma-32 factor
MNSLNLPILSHESGFFKYLQEIKRFPSLEPDEEYMLAKRFAEHFDVNAAHKLVTSHLKLVAKIATSFRGYNMPMMELVSEGNIGLMQAVKKFNPELGYRLSTYAVWWIKAAIQEYILKSWSLVKIGTTAAQKKLFFNLGKIKRKLKNLDANVTNEHAVSSIANELNVSEKEVNEMNGRMLGMDLSLNQSIDNDMGSELIELLPETRANQEASMASNQESSRKKKMLYLAMEKLNEREKYILSERHLKEDPATLEDLSQHFNISRERVRQIESRVFEKLRADIQIANS